MTTKYYVKYTRQSASQLSQKKNILRSPVNANLLYYMRTACSRYNKRLRGNRNEKNKTKNHLHSLKQKGIRKKREKLKKMSKNKAIHQQVIHQFKTELEFKTERLFCLPMSGEVF